MESKQFYFIPKDPANDPPCDPDFSDDFEEDFIDAENEETRGPSVTFYRTPPPDVLARILAEIKTERRKGLSPKGVYGRKAE